MAIIAPEQAPELLTEARGYESLSEFWQDARDFFGEGGLEPAVVLQYGYDMSGKITAHDDDERGEELCTIEMQRKEAGTFAYRFISTNDTGRCEYNNTDNILTVYDKQGRESERSTVENGDLRAEIYEEIMRAINSKLFAERVAKLKARRESAMLQVSTFEEEGKLRYAPKKYEKMLEEKRAIIQSVRFTKTAELT